MPELPENETIKRGLQKYVAGHKVQRVDVRLPKIVKEGDVKKLVGGKMVRARRFGKSIVMDFDNGWSVASHIKLTGQWVYDGPNKPKRAKVSEEYVDGLPNKYSHVIFYLDCGGKLYYNDVRQFGWLRVVKTDDVPNIKFIKELGPEPLDGLTLDKFREILKGRNTKVKVLLMDQKKIGGVGNIYANDALFLARIDPRRPAKSLSGREVEKLYKAIDEVLKRGLKYGGATELNYVNALGEEGAYQDHFLAYGKEGQPCPRNCGGTFKKITLGGRGTYFCEHCQK